MTSGVDRRRFLVAGAAAFVAPMPTVVQSRLPRLGIVTGGDRSREVHDPIDAGPYHRRGRTGSLVVLSAPPVRVNQARVDDVARPEGARIGELPGERPSKFILLVNLKTAKALGLTLPQSVLLSTDRVLD